MTVSASSSTTSSPCTAFQQNLDAYLANLTSDHTHLVAALTHLQGCRSCQRNVTSLLEGLFAEQEDLMICDEAEFLLPDYVDACLLDEAMDEQWRALQQHLLTCPHCAESFLALQAMVLEAHRPMMNPQSAPRPDLSFLSPKPSTSVASTGAAPIAETATLVAGIRWRIDNVGAFIIELSQGLWDAFPPPMVAGLKSESARRILCQIDLNEIFADLTVSITAKEVVDDPTHCELFIDVDVPSRGGWPHLAGIDVSVRHGSQSLGHQRTDAYGKTVFSTIPVADLAELTVQVQPHLS